MAALAGLKAGLFKSEDDIEALWQRDVTVQPKVKRDTEYGGWQRALKGAFACAGVSMGNEARPCNTPSSCHESEHSVAEQATRTG